MGWSTFFAIWPWPDMSWWASQLTNPVVAPAPRVTPEPEVNPEPPADPTRAMRERLAGGGIGGGRRNPVEADEGKPREGVPLERPVFSQEAPPFSARLHALTHPPEGSPLLTDKAAMHTEAQGMLRNEWASVYRSRQNLRASIVGRPEGPDGPAITGTLQEIRDR